MLEVASMGQNLGGINLEKRSFKKALRHQKRGNAIGDKVQLTEMVSS